VAQKNIIPISQELISQMSIFFGVTLYQYTGLFKQKVSIYKAFSC